MAIIFIRTVIFFLILTAVMRMTGKRQIGEMQLGEFVTAFLISEMAALPITDMDIPMMHGITAICVLGSLETLTAFLVRKSVKIRRVLIGEPVVLVSDGRFIEKALTKTRISPDDVFTAIRQAGYRIVGDVQYVILEPNGKMSVLPKADFDRLTPSDMGITVENTGMTHTVVIDGEICRPFMDEAPMKESDIAAEVKRKKTDRSDILFMTCDNMGNKITVLKSGDGAGQSKQKTHGAHRA